jgi:acetyl/propionyl-CoA carboxylase alpha subunit
MKLLVANRGEIAIRIFRTCRELDIPSVAVYTDPDEVGLHVRYADEAVAIGDVKNYLNQEKLIEAALRSGATSIHPGYGFLSENAEFAQRVEDAGLQFIGPRPETIERMGDKLNARKTARQAGLPVLEGPDIPLPRELAYDMITGVKYPVLVKAAAGGGGRGIYLARNQQELEQMVAAARRESQAVFGDDNVYLEPMVSQARHIEVQILGDGNGQVLCLGDRECSIQRRRQKLIEEAPAPGLDEHLRAKIHANAMQLARHLNYRSLGTVEFLLDAEGVFYFIEVNPRIQVEHPVTEMITGLDLIRAQLLLAMTGRLQLKQEQIEFRGAAIEARVLAEDAEQGFLPASGEIKYLKEPGGPGVRVDSSLYLGMPVRTDYDSLLAKVITTGDVRYMAIARLRRALSEFQIGGVSTDLDFLQQVIDSQQFLTGTFDTTYLDHFELEGISQKLDFGREIAAATALYAHRHRYRVAEDSSQVQNYWLLTAWREQMRNGA